MIKKNLLIQTISLSLVIGLYFLLMHLKNSNQIDFWYSITDGKQPVGNFRDIYAALVSFYGGNLGFVIASVTIVFGVIDRPTFDKLFRNDKVSELYILFFLVILSSAANAVFAFFGMLFNVSSEKYLTFAICLLIHWLIQFSYFIIIFGTVIKVSIDERKSKIKSDAKSKIEERQNEGKSLNKNNT